MNDNPPSLRSDLQALRLICAFLRISDQQTRTELVEKVERLAGEAALEPVSSPTGLSEFAQHPADPLS
jgi:hypothetical protein